MQISGANLLIASQQAQKPAAQPQGNAAFASALKSQAAPGASDGFEPLPLKKAAGPAMAAPEAAPANAASPTPDRLTPPGRNLDIRV